MSYEQSLQNLGVSKQESQVYVAALKYGTAPASNIAKAAGLKRTTVYPILQSLAKQGLIIVSFKHKERCYTAQSPTTIARRYEKTLADFTNIIPELNALQQKQTNTFGLRFLETSQEVTQFFSDILVSYKNKEYKVISSTQGWMSIAPDFFQQFRLDRAKARIRTKLILTHESRYADPPNNTLLRTAKYLPPSYHFKSSINIFAREILLTSPELASLAVVIEIPAMTDIFNSVFELLWSMLPEENNDQ